MPFGTCRLVCAGRKFIFKDFFLLRGFICSFYFYVAASRIFRNRCLYIVFNTADPCFISSGGKGDGDAFVTGSACPADAVDIIIYVMRDVVSENVGNALDVYEGGMGILPDHEPVLTVIKQGTLTVVEPDGDRHMFEVTDGFISFDSNKLTVAVERGHDVQYSGTAE